MGNLKDSSVAASLAHFDDPSSNWNSLTSAMDFASAPVNRNTISTSLPPSGLSAKNISASIVAQILTTQTSEGPLSDNQVDALLDQLLQVETPAAVPASDDAPSSDLIQAWLAASPADRLALLNSDPAGFVNGAWQFMDAHDRADFLSRRSAEVVSLPDDSSHHPLVPSSDGEAKVVQLFQSSEDRADAVQACV